MGFFKGKYERELNIIIERIQMNMSNNYKDAAQENLKELQAKYESFCREDILKEKQKLFYETQIDILKEKMKGFTHKDQKPYWT